MKLTILKSKLENDFNPFNSFIASVLSYYNVTFTDNGESWEVEAEDEDEFDMYIAPHLGI